MSENLKEKKKRKVNERNNSLGTEHPDEMWKF